MKTGIEKIDELFGSGILPGLSFTLTGVAGAGKSSALLQILNSLALQGKRVAYLTGEEDLRQVAFNCRRLGVEDVLLSNETDINKIKDICRESDIVIIDSFPCITLDEDLPKEKREKKIVDKIIDYCEQFECAIGVILHLTKSGQYKGSTYITHAVGANFQIELDPDLEEYRMIGSSKNRYGPTKQFSFLFGHRGFEFDVTREIVNVKSKSAMSDEQINNILKMTESPFITKERVIRELNVTSSKAYTLIKGLSDSGKIKKHGRGDAAFWTVEE
jgi:DNA repair protein RadA/Sms